MTVAKVYKTLNLYNIDSFESITVEIVSAE